MPDPLLYLQAIAASAAVGALVVMAIVGRCRPVSTLRLSTACVVGIGVSAFVGAVVLRLPVAWPPRNGLDRLSTIVLPAVLLIEWLGGLERVPRWFAWLLRLTLAAVSAAILLYGSVYLRGPGREWTFLQANVSLVVGGALLAALWALVSWLSQRSPGVSIPLALALSILSAGMAIMMAGYIAGGAAAVILAAALATVTIVARCITKCAAPQAIVGAGVIGLFGFVTVGLFFGRLSYASAVAMLFAPPLCWTTELPPLRCQKPWVVESLRLSLVAIPLVVVLGFAALEFQRHTAPLLGSVGAAETTDEHR